MLKILKLMSPETPEGETSEDVKDTEPKPESPEKTSEDEISAEAGDGKDSSTDKPWRTPENAAQAQKRRQQEEELKRKADFLDKASPILVNNFTGEKIQTEEDLKIFKAMKLCDSRNEDPMDSKALLKAVKELENEEKTKQEQEVLAQKEQENKLRQKAQSEISEFKEAYPEYKDDAKLNALLQDESFVDYSDGKLGGNKTVKEIYEAYLKFQEKQKARLAKEVSLEVARRMGSPQPSSTKSSQSDFTVDDVSGMSREEIEANYESIRNSFKK